LLELAEQKGGIGDWLARWNAMMRDPSQRTDISRMADMAESIRLGIEFQKALIRELELLAISLLNSIAYEISRQLGEALAKSFQAGSKLVVAGNTLGQKAIMPEATLDSIRQDHSPYKCTRKPSEEALLDALIFASFTPHPRSLPNW
jgi:hypothetical protein